MTDAAAGAGDGADELSYNISGITVQFPVKPYKVQMAYMERLITALKEESNALLESPTGTGKTLSILCSALAWQEATKDEIMLSSGSSVHEGGQVQYESAPIRRKVAGGFDLQRTMLFAPKIIYASRTHSQLSQVVQELKRTKYSPRICVLGSRKQLCVHPKVKKMTGSEQVQGCRALCADRRCHYRRNLDDYMEQGGSPNALPLAEPTVYGGPRPVKLRSRWATGSIRREGSANPPGRVNEKSCILDIEELARAGEAGSFCPYFLARRPETVRDSDLILMPYNYLVDPAVRKKLEFGRDGLYWRDAVVIIDEAHNIEQVCASAFSFDLTPQLLATCHLEAKEVLHAIEQGEGIGMLLNDLKPCARGEGDVGQHEAAGHVEALVMLLHELEDAIQKRELPKAGSGPVSAPCLIEPGENILDFLGTWNLTRATWPKLEALLTACAAWKDARAQLGGLSRSVMGHGGGSGASSSALSVLCDALRLPLNEVPPPAGRAGDGAPQLSVQQQLDAAKRRGVRKGEALKALQQKVKQEAGRQVAVSEKARRRAARLDDEHGRATIEDFRLVFTQTTVYKNRQETTTGKTMGLWCFNSGYAMRSLMELGVRSMVLTSGTLSPMESYASELRLPFPIRLENPHVVDGQQVLVRVVKKSPSGASLNSVYARRETPEYKRALGETVVKLCSRVPDGVLVFFPSYRAMESCIQFWRTAASSPSPAHPNVWQAIERQKLPLVESRRAADLAVQMESYDAAITTPGGSGAIFFAVCRGKVSEGLNFADRRARAVLVTGLPYPPRHDPHVALKESFLDKQRQVALQHRSETLKVGGKASSMGDLPPSGREWYGQQATRAVNQAIGRVIRHRGDFGAILLCDERFERQRRGLSAWLRPLMAVDGTFKATADALTQFYRGAALATREAAAADPATKASRARSASDSGAGNNRPGSSTARAAASGCHHATAAS